MNARLYDPVVGRFLSPDPYIQAPDFSQNYNRYSYALNNPLIYTDPNGEAFLIDDIVGAVIGGVVNLGVNIWQGNISGSPWEMIGKGAAAFTAGAIGGALMTYGPAGWAAAGAIIGGTNAAISGQNIAQGMFIGAASGLVGGYAGRWAASSLGSVSLNGYSIASPLIKGAATGAVGGAIGGYASGFTSGLLLTGNLSVALESGYSGLKFGAVLGMFSGAKEGYKYAKDNDLNIWSGKTAIQIEMESWAKANNIYTANNHNLDPKTVESYYQKFENKSITQRELMEVSVNNYNGKTIITGGNHRVAASIQYGIKTGDFSYYNTLRMNAGIEYTNPSDYGRVIRPFKF